HRPDLGGLADQQRVTEALHEFVKPQGVASALDTDGHRARQRAVELLDSVVGVEELVLFYLAVSV
ncbi:MAG TPA: hypothetical protein VFW70_20960, partial [Methylomirabilota bacterium]|nr:hypothetical protein [Methylomirabilota bacterium]